jgi:nucleoid-associated protein YgaU
MAITGKSKGKPILPAKPAPASAPKAGASKPAQPLSRMKPAAAGSRAAPPTVRKPAAAPAKPAARPTVPRGPAMPAARAKIGAEPVEPKTPAARAAAPAGPAILAEYTVASGDTLSAIADRFYKSAAREKWMKIYETNKDVIGPNPGMIKAGQVLKIPKL